MAWTNEYTISLTTLEGNTLSYTLQEDGGAGAGNAMDLTENSYELEFYFNDANSYKLGMGFITKEMTLEFFGDDEINDILAAPDDWRLVVTLDGNTIFVGFPDSRSIEEYAFPEYSDIYTCSFYSVFTKMKTNPSLALPIIALGNATVTNTQAPITTLIGSLVYEYYTGVSSDVFVALPWQSENCLVSTSPDTRRLDPHLRYFQVNQQDFSTYIADLLLGIAKAFCVRIGYSHIEGKTLILLHTAGADGSSISGYDCLAAASGYDTRSSATVSLQTIASDGSDFITDDKKVNSENPIIPKYVTVQDLTNGVFTEDPNSNQKAAVDDPIDITITFETNQLCTDVDQGITVAGVSFANQVLGQLDQVDPSSLSTLYDLAEAVVKRFGLDYILTDPITTGNLKGFRVNVNKALDPMIPITYDSKVYVAVEGTINLFEETTEVLLAEIQDNG